MCLDLLDAEHHVVASQTLQYTAWAVASRLQSVAPYAIAQWNTRLLRILAYEKFKQSERDFKRHMRNASESRRTLEEMGMLDPNQDSWQKTVVTARLHEVCALKHLPLAATLEPLHLHRPRASLLTFPFSCENKRYCLPSIC